MKKHLYTILLVLCSAVFLFSGYKLVSALLKYKKANDTYDEIREAAAETIASTEAVLPEDVPEETEEEEDAKSPYLVCDYPDYPDYSDHEHLEKLDFFHTTFDYVLMPYYSMNFDSLIAANPDVKAWIRIEDTKVDYPVVQGEDNSKYLRVGADGEPLNAGAIFIDYRVEDPFNDPVTILYGHNQRNHSIFHDLHKYRNEDFFNEHPFIEIYLPDGSAIKYQVFAAGLIDAYGSNYRISFQDDADFLSYLDLLQENSEHGAHMNLTAEDSIIILSTCTNDYDESKRMIVCARKISTE